MTPLVAWIILASTHVSDAAGNHPLQPIPKDAAEAIAESCESVRNVGGVDARTACAAVLVVHSFRESGWKLDAVGDGGKAHGPFQIHNSIAPKTWREALQQFVPLLRRSAQVCLEPLAMLASGSCTNKAGIAISKARMQAARDLVKEVPFKPDGAT